MLDAVRQLVRLLERRVVLHLRRVDPLEQVLERGDPRADDRRQRVLPGELGTGAEKRAGFGRLVAVPPLSSGGVSTTSRTTLAGSSTATGTSSMICM